MLTNNKLRTLLIALAATSLMACQSGPTEAEKEAEANRMAEQAQAEARQQEQARAEAERVRVEAAKAEQMKRAQEVAEEMKNELVNQNTIYFDFDRSTIKSDFVSVLRKHAEYLLKNPNQVVVVEGHADQRGTPEYNIALGERRGKSVETFLLNEGVSPSQVSVVSFGEEKPAVMGASEYAMAQNRRAVVVYQ